MSYQYKDTGTKLVLICPKDCKYLSPKEEDQKPYEHHFCLKYHVVLFHGGLHPSLSPCKQCITEGAKL